MTKPLKIWTLIFFAALMTACSNKKESIPVVTAEVETEPVKTIDDAADDIAIWIDKTNPAQSLIIGTNKKDGIAIYNFDGKQIEFIQVGRVNNVDLRYGFALGDDTVDIIALSNRTYNNIELFSINPKTRELKNIADTILPSEMRDEVYGCCLYKSAHNGKFYVNISSKAGEFGQWEIFAKDSSKVTINKVRSFEIGSVSEGMVADDELGNLFISEERVGVWKYAAEPDKGNQRQLICDSTNNVYYDIEGLSIYKTQANQGYLLVSSQGNNSYIIFNRTGNHEYISRFVIGDAENIDGTYETDGIDACNYPFSKVFPQGVFIAQDGANTQGSDTLNQNFKVVDWQKIQKTIPSK